MIDKQLKAMIDKKGLTLEKLSMLSNVPIETIRTGEREIQEQTHFWHLAVHWMYQWKA